MSKTMVVLYACFVVTVVVFLIANFAYQIGGTLAGQIGKITSGPDAGRQGRIVSFYLFDLKVTINTAASEPEKQQLIKDYLADGVGWKMPDEAKDDGENVVKHVEGSRHWCTVWRWQVETHPDAPPVEAKIFTRPGEAGGGSVNGEPTSRKTRVQLTTGIWRILRLD